MKKVTAKNLMIGDWVEYKGSKRKVFNTHLYNDNSSTFWLEVDDKKIIATTATPIPITEEWLKLNGFELAPLTEKVIYGKSISKDCTIFHMTYDNVSSLYVTLYKKDTADVECQTSVVNAKYIHQLQQAYRLATGGKELKVKF
jgi:hypothetical protein